MSSTTGIGATRSRARREQSLYSNAVREFGRDSVQAKTAEGEYWCVRLCTLIEDSIAQHPLTDEQRQRIADVALGAHITFIDEHGERTTGRVLGTAGGPN